MTKIFDCIIVDRRFMETGLILVSPLARAFYQFTGAASQSGRQIADDY
ncbi:MAG: hypothetical protein LH628_05355 [Microcoleus sp. CAN_BIN18]|nr:hypothetical protein [Microcoleus sp. CAN_BIN18]